MIKLNQSYFKAIIMELDKQDLKLLNILQVDVKTSIESLSEEVGLSPASIQRRLK